MKDKILAIIAILRANEFDVFTCKSFLKAQGSECIVSLGVEDRIKSKIFRESVSEFIMKL